MPASREGPSKRALAPVKRAQRQDRKRARKKNAPARGIAAAVSGAVNTGARVASHARGPKPHQGRTVFNTPVGGEFNRKGVPRTVQHERKKATHAGQKAAARTQAPLVGAAPLLSRAYLRKHPAARAQLGKQLEQAAARAGKQGIQPGWATLNYLKATDRPGALQPYRRSQTVGRQEQHKAQEQLRGARVPDYHPIPKRPHGVQKAGLDAIAALGNGDPNTSHNPIAVVFNNSTPIGWTARDLAGLAASPVVNTYQVGKAGLAAAHGDTSEAKNLVKGFVNTDPIALAAQGRFKESGNAVLHHPVSTYLELRGGVAALGHVGGKTARSGVLGKKAKAAGSTERAPKVVEGTTLEQHRAYSRDIIKKGVQVAGEKRARRRVINADRRAQKLRDAGNHDEAANVVARAAEKAPDRMSDRDVMRRMDERVAATEDLRKQHKSQIIDTVHRTRIPKRGGGHLVGLVAQRIVKPTRDDLEAYAAELEEQFRGGGLSGAEKAANKRLRSSIGRALKRKSLDFDSVARAADEYVKVSREQQQQLVDAEMLSSARGDRARLIPYAVRNMGARHDGEQIVDSEGRPLSTEQIRQHMEDNNVGEPAFITQAPNQRGTKNFFKSWDQGAAISNKTRTGSATLKGTFDTHRDVLAEQAAHTQGLIDANAGHKEFVGEFGLRSNAGRVKAFVTRGQADRAARELMFDEHGNEIPGARAWRVVRIKPFGGTEEQLSKLLEDTHNHDYETSDSSPVIDAIDRALKGEGEGPYALVPDAAAQRLSEHLRLLGAGSGGKVFQVLSGVFRKTVLATSVKWLTGNVAEAGLRTAIDRAGPSSWWIGHKTFAELERLDPKAAEEARIRAAGGGHYSFAGKQVRYSGAEQFRNAPPALRNLAKGLGTFWRAPGPKQVAKTWGLWTHLIFEGINSRFERQVQTAMAGKHIRQQLMPDHLIKVSQQAIEDAANGLRNTNAQVAMGRAVDRAYGKYGKFTPGQRKAITMYTPFAAWSLSAARFVFDVLPNDHPVLTGLLAAQNNATEEWRKDKGLDQFLTGAVPGFLQGSIPTDKGWIRATRYTPFGAFTDPGDTVSGLLLPQLSGVVQALQGRDWKGDALNGPYGPAATPDEKFAAAFEAFLEGTVPFSAQAHRVLTNPDGPKAGILKEINPIAPVSQSKKKKSGGTSSGGGGWGGGSSSSSSGKSEDFSKTGGW